MARTFWTEAGPIRTTERVSPDWVEEANASAAASAADPVPLGMAAFGLTTFLLGIIYGAFPYPGLTSRWVIPIAFWFGGLTQFLAAMWAMRKGNTFAATVMGVLSGFWITAAAVAYFAPLAPFRPGTAAAGAIALGLFGIITLYLCAAALEVNAAMAVLLGLTTCTFWIAAIGLGIGSMAAARIAGWFGVATGIVAFYTSFALVIDSAARCEMVPLGRLRPERHFDGVDGDGAVAPACFRDQFQGRSASLGTRSMASGLAGAKGGEVVSPAEPATIPGSDLPIEEKDIDNPAR